MLTSTTRDTTTWTNGWNLFLNFFLFDHVQKLHVNCISTITHYQDGVSYTIISHLFIPWPFSAYAVVSNWFSAWFHVFCSHMSHLSSLTCTEVSWKNKWLHPLIDHDNQLCLWCPQYCYGLILSHFPHLCMRCFLSCRR